MEDDGTICFVKGGVKVKKLLSSLFVLVLVFSSFSMASAAGLREVNVSMAAAGFKDIPKNYWAEEEIQYLISQKIITGYSDGTFRPNDKLSRIQVALMVQRAKGYSEANRPNPNLTDIKPGNKYYSLVATLMDEGLFSHLVKNRTFDPGKTVTRAEMASILAKAYNLTGISNKKFSDVPSNHWAYKFVQALAANDITYGITETTFGPNNDVNRVQFSAFLARTLNEDLRDNTMTNPASVGELWEFKGQDWYGYRNYHIGITDVVTDGATAWQMIKQANPYNQPPPAGMKYVLAHFYFKLIKSDEQPYNLSYINIDAVKKNGDLYDHYYVDMPDPALSAELTNGQEYMGWAAFVVDENDEAPLLVWKRSWTDQIWFEMK